jgi:flagellin
METAMERLSSGLRINSAADDAAGLAVAGKMESQLRGINMSVRNAQDGVGLIQTGESGLNEIRNMVLRIRELAVQMANGIYENTPDRANAQLEVAALLEQVDLIAENTRFNDVALLDGSFTGVTIQAGNTTAETIQLSFIDVGQTGLSINGAAISTQASATTVIGTMDSALETIASEQATMGSLINRLNFSVSNLSKASVMTEQAIGRVMDADFASETTQLSKQQILNQAATSMLAQANQSKQSILALLQ